MQTAGVGFDLKATNHQHYEHRCVEVKAILEGLRAVTLEQSEWAQAQQLGSKYWLYVVVNCGTDNPEIVLRVQDPASVFTGPSVHQRFTIPVSDLRQHATE